MAPIRERWKYSLFLLKKSRYLMVGLGLLIFLVFLAFFGRYVSPYDPYLVNLSDRLSSPTISHPFGTDELGRDVLSRTLDGARNSLTAGLITVGVGVAFGLPIGSVAAYFGKKIDMIVMRIVDVLQAFPTLILAMALCAPLGTSLFNASFAVGIAFVPGFVRLIRSKVLSVKEMEYVAAAKAIGAPTWRVLFLHVLPNSIEAVFVSIMISVGYGILWTTSLSFIGLGAQPPQAEWGLMILSGRDYVLTGEWWLPLFPGFFTAMAIAAFNMIGDGLRDILSPKLRIT